MREGTLKRVEIRGAFGLDKLTIADDESISVGPDEIRIDILANSLNYRDLLMVKGLYDPSLELPTVPGSDACGVIVEKGDEVSLELGEMVSPLFAPGWDAGPLPSGHLKKAAFGANRPGLLRSEYVLPASEVVRTPRDLSAVEASCLPCAALTAWHALFEEQSIKENDLIVTQGTGGVSLFALLFAKHFGAKVVITSSSDSKLEKCRELGADYTINYRDNPKWGAIVKEISEGKGADHIIELGGQDTLKESVKSIKSNGNISLIGVLGGPVASLILPLVVMRNVRLQGVTVGSKSMHESMNTFIEKHSIKPVVDKVFEFSETRNAFEYLASGQQFGKIAIEQKAIDQD